MNHLHLVQVLLNCTQQNECIRFHTLTKLTSIHVVVHLLNNYLGLLKNDMGRIYFLNTKSKV